MRVLGSGLRPDDEGVVRGLVEHRLRESEGVCVWERVCVCMCAGVCERVRERDACRGVAVGV